MEKNERFSDIISKPFELSKDNEKNLFKLQKMFYSQTGARFSKILFKEHEIENLVYLFIRLKQFRKLYPKMLKEFKQAKKEE